MSEKKRGITSAFLQAGGEQFLADSVVLRGRHTAIVYGCRRILRYQTDQICLFLGKHCVSVCGKDLSCLSFNAGTATLSGDIGGVRYCPAGCEKRDASVFCVHEGLEETL